MKRYAAVVLFVLLLAAAPTARGQDWGHELETALADPPATGLLVTFVSANSQAQTVGLRPGDVVTTYAGTAIRDLASLAARKAEVAEEKSVAMVYVRGGDPVTVQIAPGQIGFNAVPVEKGKPPAPLPEEKNAALDLSSLSSGMSDSWYSFTLDGKQKAGYEHTKIQRAGGKLFLFGEVAFDGGEGTGLQHFRVTVVMTAEPRPQLVLYRMETPLTNWRMTGVVTSTRPGERRLLRTWRSGDESGNEEPVRLDGEAIPTYFVEALARYLPREKDTCLQFRPVNEGGGITLLKSAVVCLGEEEIQVDGRTVKAWHYDWLNLAGAVSASFWFGPDGEMVLADWGGAKGRLTTKEKALEGVPKELLPAR